MSKLKMYSTRLPEDLLSALDRYTRRMKRKNPRIDKSRIVEKAITEFLEREDAL